MRADPKTLDEAVAIASAEQKYQKKVYFKGRA
jgi:hypothetical protein